MEELSSAVSIFRKRKKIPSSSADQFDGTLTRSKAQMCIHRSGSGCSPPDVISEKSLPVEDFSVLNCGNAWGGSSIKDLRARRVFTPDVNSILAEQNEDKLEEGKDSLKGLDSESGQLDADSGYMKVDVTEIRDEVIASEVEEVKQSNTDNGIPTKKDDAVSGDASDVRRRMDLTLCTKRKVVKTPGSFSYRRLLPYLMDLVNDDSRVSKIEIVDAAIPCTSTESHSVRSNSKSYIQNNHNGLVERQKCHSENTKLSDNKAMQNFQSVLPCNEEDLCGRKDKMDSMAENIGLHKMEQRNHQDGMSGVDVSLKEKSIQMTPPDPDIFTQTEIGVNKENVESSTFLTETQISMNNPVCLDQNSNGKELPDSIDTLVLNPKSRRRVFKHPRSLSYRRLLPFLMEISNDNSIKQQKPIVKSIEKPHPLSAATSVGQKHVKKFRTESSYGSQQTEILEEILQPASTPPVGSSWDTGTNPTTHTSPFPVDLSNVKPSFVVSENGVSPCMNLDLHNPTTHTSPFPVDLSNVKPSLVVSENGVSPCMNLDLQTGRILQSQSSPRKSESKCPHTDTNGLERNEQSTLQIEESELVAKQTKCLELGSEVYNDNRGFIENDQLDQGTLKMNLCNTLCSTIAGHPKGILKKNPRGCRGPCNCLNCASFHLHAERAFEFSKNQMHEAEEVALELMRELAKLRHLLEKSTTNENGPEIVPLNLLQVKQACTESLETEKLAKVRLCQLNCELNIHCRIPALIQPKVTFSNYIQERSFPMLDQLVSVEKTE